MFVQQMVQKKKIVPTTPVKICSQEGKKCLVLEMKIDSLLIKNSQSQARIQGAWGHVPPPPPSKVGPVPLNP